MVVSVIFTNFPSARASSDEKVLRSFPLKVILPGKQYFFTGTFLKVPHSNAAKYKVLY